MKNTTRILLTATLASFSGTFAFAGKATEIKPAIAKPGKLIVEQDFTEASLPKNWTIAKGDWQARDGAVVGKEKPEDKHAAVLLLAEKNRNSIIRFSFKLDGTDGFALSFNHSKGHLFRITTGAGGVTINKDKDKKDPNSKGLVLGKAEGKFESGQWYTMLVEVQGTRVAVQTDNGIKVEAANPDIDVDKTGYRFVMRGASLALDDLRVWEARP